MNLGFWPFVSEWNFLSSLVTMAAMSWMTSSFCSVCCTRISTAYFICAVGSTEPTTAAILGFTP